VKGRWGILWWAAACALLSCAPARGPRVAPAAKAPADTAKPAEEKPPEEKPAVKANVIVVKGDGVEAQVQVDGDAGEVAVQVQINGVVIVQQGNVAVQPADRAPEKPVRADPQVKVDAKAKADPAAKPAADAKKDAPELDPRVKRALEAVLGGADANDDAPVKEKPAEKKKAESTGVSSVYFSMQRDISARLRKGLAARRRASTSTRRSTSTSTSSRRTPRASSSSTTTATWRARSLPAGDRRDAKELLAQYRLRTDRRRDARV